MTSAGVEKSIIQFLDSNIDYSGMLERFTGDFRPNQFVEETNELTSYQIVPSSDGLVSTVQGQDDTADKSQRSDHFDYHTDGVYLPRPPALFLLACHSPGTTDTKTAFIDTREVIAKVTEHLPILDLLHFTYIGKKGDRYSRPIVEPHPVGKIPIMNLVTRGFVEPNPSIESVQSLPDYRAIHAAMAAVYSAMDSSVAYVHSWKKGDVIVADNYTYLHARIATSPDPARKLSRIWLDSVQT